MKRTARFLSLLLAVALMLPASAWAYENPFVSPRGSCDYIDGVTVLVSIFVSDPIYDWNFDRKADKESYDHIYWRLKTASDWLTDQAHRYRASPRIVWDWYNQKYLYYEFKCSRRIDSQEYSYKELRNFIYDHVNLPMIKEYYHADNVIFLAYYNQTGKDKQAAYAWAWDFDPNAGNSYALEIIWAPDEDNNLQISAAGLAHEMMHCFGAVDLYRASNEVPQSYVDHLKKIKSNDIMYTIDYKTPDTIGEEFTDLDAYYLGLTPSADDQKTYHMSVSSHYQ